MSSGFLIFNLKILSLGEKTYLSFSTPKVGELYGPVVSEGANDAAEDRNKEEQVIPEQFSSSGGMSAETILSRFLFLCELF